MPKAAFDSSYNPYAPPGTTAEGASVAGQCWREGDLLVAYRDAALPPRCVRCNAPARTPIKRRKLYWHHPAWYFLIALNVIIYAIAATFVRTRTTVSPGLCVEHTKDRTRRLAYVWLMFLGSLLLIVTSATIAQPVFLVIPGGILLIAAVAVAQRSRVLWITSATKEVVRFKGCEAPFLESLASR